MSSWEQNQSGCITTDPISQTFNLKSEFRKFLSGHQQVELLLCCYADRYELN